MAAEDSNKVVLVGDFGVGKTTIFTRFKTGKSEGGSLNTRKESECSKSVTVDGEAMPITLYDTAGMERFEGTIPPTYFRSAKVVIFVYSVTDIDSISNIESWTDSVSPQRVGTSDIIRVLVGNKTDLEDERDVSSERGQQVAENCEIGRELFFEISAQEGTGFEEMFEAIVREIRKAGRASMSATLDLSKNEKPAGRSCCTR